MNSFSQQETNVLFIGNSFTFMNNMPTMFKEIAESKGKKVYVDSVVEGGKDLKHHSSQVETYEKIKTKKWDYLILQGHSNELAQPESKIDINTLPYAKKIVDSVRATNSCVQIVMYMTWAYKNGNPKWSVISSYDSMQYRIKNQYLRFADLLDARVSPVGEVWKNVRVNYSGINLYDPDNQHPSPAGSYLSACTHFASIFGESPIGNKAPAPLDEKVRQIIEFNASQIVLNNLNQWRFVSKESSLNNAYDLILTDSTLQTFNRSTGYTTFKWTFGDGTESLEDSPTHFYQSKGVFDVILNISNNCKTIELKRTIEVK
jgi:hypothetical protein